MKCNNLRLLAASATSNQLTIERDEKKVSKRIIQRQEDDAGRKKDNEHTPVGPAESWLPEESCRFLRSVWGNMVKGECLVGGHDGS